MTESTIWWLLAGVLVGVELITGTFYLLMLSTGLVAAAIASHLGASLTIQFAVAAIIGSAAVAIFRRYKARRPVLKASANPDANLDVGETVVVDKWDNDGTGMVKYRGAIWTVSLAAGETPSSGVHRVVEVVGSRLVLKKI